MDELIIKILHKRGITDPQEIEAFLDPSSYSPTLPPEIPGLEQACCLLLKSVERGERICVYGDYDADGVTSTALLVSLLTSLGANVRYHLPDRFKEGYGMNPGVIKELAAEGVRLILTCDCGISNQNEVSLAKELGLKVIITDHHLLPQSLPQADSIVNPQFLPQGHRARFLPGVGVAYMLARAVLEKLGRGQDVLQLLDLVTLGVVADVVPLLGENRYLVQIGLLQLRQSSRPGICALCSVAKIGLATLSEEDIAFQLVPRLNSAGRLESAKAAVELLLASDEIKALQLARELDQINSRRRALGEDIFCEVKEMLKLGYVKQPIILYKPHWHHGVLGVIAGRLCEIYQVPVALMSLKEDGTTIVGSARSIPGIHIFAALASCGDYLAKFGGHAGAAGFSLELNRLEQFSMALSQELQQGLDSQVLTGEADYDLEINFSQVGLETYRRLRSLAPFGEGNPAPRFRGREVEILSRRPIAEERHLRLVLGQERISLPAIWWWGGVKQTPFRADVIYSLGLNTWRGEETIQLVVQKITEIPIPQVAEHETSIELIDLRDWSELGREFPALTDAVHFSEAKKVAGSKDRYSITRGETLIMWSIPPGPRVLQEVWALSGASRVVLAYGLADLTAEKNFVQGLMGMLKYSLNRENGLIDIRALAASSGELEETVGAALGYLKAAGLITYQLSHGEKIILGYGNGQKSGSVNKARERLDLLLRESRAFRRFMHHATAGQICRLLNRNCSGSTGKD